MSFMTSSSWPPAGRSATTQRREEEAHYRALHGNLQFLNCRALSTSSSSSSEDGATKQEGEEEEEEEEEEEPMVTGREALEFKAETRQLLEIVTNSLYTDKEVFLRELVSNASDALEKLRHKQVTSTKTADPDLPLEIRIETDELNNTLIVSDTGVGLTRQEMVENLGTIARSGSKAYLNEVAKQAMGGEDNISRGIIGKFGVGFYSAFMVGESVQVRSKSATVKEDGTEEECLVWSSVGVGSYDIGVLNPNVRQKRGASVVITLKEDAYDFCDEKRLETILKKYSNFVQYPIYLNGTRVNTLDAIWSKDPKEVTEDEYSAFYKYIANAYDEPIDHLHYRADAPLEIKALFYIPSFHSEKYGMERMGPGVALYSRKVLIESKSPDILPDWLRFLKGVVDSEDLPLSISREKPQDSALIAKLRKAITRKVISFLTNMAKKETKKYKNEFYREYSFFLKEGVCQDYEFQEQITKLLHFETSKEPKGSLSSLDDYVSRCTPEQKEIYFLCAPTREFALQSPYLEAFEKAGREVLFVYTAIDDFVMANLEKYQDRRIVSVEKSDIDLGDLKDKDDDENKDEAASKGAEKVSLSEDDAAEFCSWFVKTLSDRVASCKVSQRLTSSPAVVTDNESGALRRMMRYVDTQDKGVSDPGLLPKQKVEINPGHAIIVGIHEIRAREPMLARVCAEQVLDNCLVAAGIMDDGRSMLPRLNDLLLCLVEGAKQGAGTSTTVVDTAASSTVDDSAAASSTVDDTATSSTVDDTAASSTVDDMAASSMVDDTAASSTEGDSAASSTEGDSAASSTEGDSAASSTEGDSAASSTEENSKDAEDEAKKES